MTMRMKGGNLVGTARDRPPTLRVGDIATNIPLPTIPEVSGDVVDTVG